MESLQRETDGTRVRWTSRMERARRDDRSAGMYAAARKRPLSSAARQAKSGRERGLGPYETRYDIVHGYGLERTILQP